MLEDTVAPVGDRCPEPPEAPTSARSRIDGRPGENTTHDTAPPGDARRRRVARRRVARRRHAGLARRLACHDGVAVTLAVAALGPVPPWERVPVQLASGLVTLGALAAQGHYRSRARTGHAVDMTGVVRAVVVGGAVSVGVARLVGADLSPARHVLLAAALALLLAVGRSLYTGRLRASRAAGRLVRPLVLVGGNDEAAALATLLDDHPEHGYRICGLVAPVEQRAVDAVGRGVPRWDAFDDVVGAVAATEASGVLVAGTAVPFDRLSSLAGRLLAAGVDVQLATGLRGLGHRRLRWQPLAHQPVLAVEAARRTRWHIAAKRAIDVTLAAVGLAVTAPVIGAAAVAIKVEDGGPVVFRHDRVGVGGRSFRLLKLRTMVPDAERLVDGLRHRNQRAGGPLTKIGGDPRVTRVGRFLRQSSIDELPQLLNVLRGDMSLVGPRPALAREVARFDDELRARRAVVRPGITGLWQAEARDNPAFGPYRRLDLFYVDNWSIALDLAILWTTAGRVLARAVRRARPVPAEVVHLETSTAGTGES